ncbi:hypothetical protein [Paludibacterium paludis]|uniref:Uncharacterized protein n=1 Tax=Paludibacterium paludis TaxID=1225769 RepID=A0A918U6Z4_9NEIS|nr:hypothetical protein [Paludibacterium paludis]GGY04981.1 hypothetical protein GCM10011289_04420 [Paludibacterium paludis]
MSFILATTEKIVRWYVYDITDTKKGFELINNLDLMKVPLLADKETAKIYAKMLGLKTWRYVKL